MSEHLAKERSLVEHSCREAGLPSRDGRTDSLAVRPRLHGWWRARRLIYARWIADALTGLEPGLALKTDLFDEASGPFHQLRDLPPRARPLGVDVDIGIAVRARRRLAETLPGARCVAADVRRLPFADQSVDMVLSPSTLDHFETVEDIARSLVEIGRVLRLRGRLLLTLDNPANIEVALRARLPKPLVRALRADNFPIGKTLGQRAGQRLLRSIGFSVVESGYMLHAPRYLMIRLIGWAERNAWRAPARWLTRLSAKLEALGRLPTRSLTGHFVNWVAVRDQSDSSRQPDN